MASQKLRLRFRRMGLQFIKPQVRQLTLHQYQSQELLKEAGATIPRGLIARSAEEARAAVLELGSNSLVIAQLLKRSVVSAAPQKKEELVASNPEKAAALATELLRGSGFGSGSTSDRDCGAVARELYITEPITTKSKELWHITVTIDREAYQPCIMISRNKSSTTGVSSSSSNDFASSYSFILTEGITEELVNRIATDSGLLSGGRDDAATIASLRTTLVALSRVFADCDGLLLETAVLVSRAHADDKGIMTCVDSRLVLDDAARGRQPALFGRRDRTQEVDDEVEAETHGLVYVRLDNKGDSSSSIVGTVVNGAGLAMATNDAIGQAGGRSANFLDAGGQATVATVKQALRIVLGDERIRSILVNIYGGITRGDMIAESIIGAASEIDIHVPIVVRLQGTNSEEGLKLLADANLGIHVESDFGKAAQKAVELARAQGHKTTRP